MYQLNMYEQFNAPSKGIILGLAQQINTETNDYKSKPTWARLVVCLPNNNAESQR